MRVGILPFARSTFDVPYAEAVLADALDVLDTTGHDLLGPRELLFDAAQTEAALAAIDLDALDVLLVLQVTFTDGSMAGELAERVPVPLVFWSFPEARTGGRLRLNAFCGVNLAAHVAGLRGRTIGYLHAPAAATSRGALEAVLARAATGDLRPPSPPPVPTPPAPAVARGAEIADALAGRVVGRIGDHPTGFDPCRYDRERLRRTTGMDVDRVELPDLFAAADAAPPEAVDRIRAEIAGRIADVDTMEPEGLERSLRIYLGLDRLVAERGWQGVATRCWPECFTEYGGAVCAPHGLLSERGVPGCCEADVYGNVTAQILDALTGEPSFVADLVDADDGTVVFWHCGLAAPTLADPDTQPRATIHSNRRKPLLFEFPLRPGRITVFRLSQARDTQTFVVGGGEMLDRPLPFSGTAGTARLDAPVPTVLDRIVGWGLEHHYGIAYGDVRNELRALADRWGLPVLELT